MDTFPIVREQDIKAFGRYRTKEDVLAILVQIGGGALPPLNPHLLELALGER